MKQKAILVISILAAAVMIAGALLLSAKDDAALDPSKAAQRKLSLSQLAEFDGKDGQKCYVAIDSKVYEIEQGRYWQNGKHTTSNEQAYCGRDLSAVIGKSPHGKSKLTALPIVGTLAN